MFTLKIQIHDIYSRHEQNTQITYYLDTEIRVTSEQSEQNRTAMSSITLTDNQFKEPLASINPTGLKTTQPSDQDNNDHTLKDPAALGPMSTQPWNKQNG